MFPDVPARIVDDSRALNWSHAHVQHWHDFAHVAEFEAPSSDWPFAVLTTAGSARIDAKQNGQWRRAHFVPGSIGVTPAGMARTLRWRSTSERQVESMHIFLAPKMVEEISLEFLPRSRAAFPDYLDIDDPDLTGYARTLAWSLRHRAPALYADAAAQLLAGRIMITPAERPTPALGMAALGRVLEFMRDNMASDLTLDELAGIAHTSKYHFVRRFKQATGRPPYAYLRQLRLQRAAELLTNSALPAQQIAIQCGYRSASQFGAAFRRQYGSTPRQFRAHV